MTLSPKFTSISWLVAGVITLAGMLATPWESSKETADYLTTIGTNATQGQIAAVLLHFGYLALVPAFFGLYWQMRDRPGKLRTVGGVLSVFGVIGLPGMLVVDFYAIALQQNLPIDQAVKVEEAAHGMAGSAVIIMTTVLPMMIGAIALLVAAYRAKLLPLWTAIAFAFTMIAPMVGAPIVSVAGGAGILVVGIGITYRLIGPGSAPSAGREAVAPATA